MATTYNMVHLAAAIRKAQSGKSGPPTADEVMTEARRYGLLLKIEDRISINTKAMLNAGKARLKAALEWREADRKFQTEIAKMTNANALSLKKEYLGDLNRLIKKSEAAISKAGGHNHLLVQKSLDNARDQNYRGGRGTSNAMFNAFFDANPFGPGGEPRRLDKIEDAQALKRLMLNFNDKANHTLFDIDDQTGKLLNLEELKNPETSPLVTRKILTPAEHAAFFESGDSNDLVIYNLTMGAHERSMADSGAHIKSLQDLANEIEVATKPEDVVELFAKAKEGVAQLEDIAESPGTFDIADMEALSDQLADYEELEDSNERLKAMQKKLMEEDPSRADKLRTNMGISVSSTAFRAWAADNGFDELGRINLGEDGKLDFDSYVQGRDDLAAVNAFYRQQKRGPGGYGMRKVGTGEIVQFRLNGELITGERMKFHAADPPGVVRVMVQDRDPPSVMLRPGDVDQIDIIKRDPERTTRVDRAARRGLFFGGGAIQRAADESLTPPDMVNAAMIEGRGYVVDQDGRHLSNREYEERLNEQIQSSSVTGKRVGDQDYLVTGDGRTFRVGADGSTTLVEEDGNEEELFRVSEAPGRRVVVQDASEEGNAVVPTIAQIESGQLPSQAVFETVEGETPIPGLDSAFWDATDQDRMSSITPETMGFTISEEYDPRARQTFTNKRNIAGTIFVDLEASPDQEAFSGEIKVETDPDVPDPAAAAEAAFNQATFDALSDEQNNVIGEWNELFKTSRQEALDNIPEGYELVAGVGLRPIVEPPQAEPIEPGDFEGFDTTPIVGEEKVDPLSDEEQLRIRRWTQQSRDANLEGKPGPAIPDGYVLDAEMGLIPERLAKPEAPAAQPRQDSQLDMSQVDMDAFTAPPPTPTQPQSPPAEALSDAEIDAMTAPEPPIEEQFPPPPPTPELPPDVMGALRATPESEQARKDAEAKAKAEAEKAKDPDPVSTALNKAAIEDAAGEPESKGEIKLPPTGPTKIEDKTEDVKKKAVELAAEIAKREEERKTTKRDKIRNVFKQTFGSEDPLSEATESDESQDAVQTEGQTKVKSTPPVVGQNTEPPKTPEPPESTEFTSDDVAKAKAAMDALRNMQSDEAVNTRNQTEGAVQ